MKKNRLLSTAFFGYAAIVLLIIGGYDFVVTNYTITPLNTILTFIGGLCLGLCIVYSRKL